MNAVYFRFGSGPYFNLSAGGSETWLDWTVGIFGEVFIDQKFMGLFSLLFGAGMILFIDRASRRGRRAVLLNLWRNAPLLLIGVLHLLLWNGDVLTAYAVSSVFLTRPAKAAELGAYLRWSRRVRPIRCQCDHRSRSTWPTRPSTSLSGLWTPGEVLGPRGYCGPRPAGLLPTRIGADPRRRRPVSHRLYERRLACEDISTDRDGRACRRPAACRRRSHHYRGGRLLSRDHLYRPDSQHTWHDPLVAGIHEPHYYLEQPRGRPGSSSDCAQSGGWR